MVASGLLAVLALSASVDAPDESSNATTAPPSEYETIIIQGDKLELTLEKNPTSVVVFTERQLGLATEHDFKELVGRVPNVSVDPVTNQITIRGMKNKGFSGIGPPNTSMLVDGAQYFPYWVDFSNYPLFDVSQVEVLRGSQIFAGIQSGTGTISITARKPTFTPDGTLQIDATDLGRREVGAAYGDALVDDVLAYRVAIDAVNDDGLIDNVERRDSNWNDAERYLFRGQLLWRPAQWSDAEVRFEYQRLKDDLGAPTIRINHVLRSDGYNPFHRKTGIDAAEKVRQHFDVFNLEVEHPLGESWRVSYVASYQACDTIQSVADFDATSAPGGTVNTVANTKAYQGEIRVTHDGPWTLRAALYTNNLNPSDTHADLGFAADLDGDGPVPPVTALYRFGYADHLAGRVYATALASHTWFNRVTTDFGARSLLASQFDSKRTTGFGRRGTTGDPATDTAYDDLFSSFGTSSDRQFDDYRYTLPVASISVDLTPELSMGTRYEQGYRIGETALNVARREAVPYRPETSVTKEVFLRSRWFDGRVTLNANVFETDYENLQLQKCFSDDPLDCAIVNAATGTTNGAELEFSYAPSDAVNGWLSFGQIDTHYKDVAAQIVESPTDLARNAEKPWNLSGGIDYEQADGLFAHIDATYESAGSVSLNSANVVSTRSVMLVNTRLGWRLPARDGMTWEVAMYARNLLDKSYLQAIDPAQPDGVNQNAYVGDPRVVGLTLHLYF